MPRFPKEKIDEQYKKLPDALKDAIFSVDVANKIFEIGKKFALTIEETGFLGEEAGYVMLGLVHPNDFAKSIQARIEVDEEEIQQVAKEVNAQVFYPIRELFKRAHQFEVIAAEEKTAEEKPKETIPSANPALDHEILHPVAGISATTAVTPRQDREAFKGGVKTFGEIKFKEIEEEIKKETLPPLSQKPFFSKPATLKTQESGIPAPEQVRYGAGRNQESGATVPSAVKLAPTIPAKPVEDSSPLPRPVVRPVPVEKPPSMPPTDKKEPSQPLVVPPKPELQPAPPPLTQRIPPIDLRQGAKPRSTSPEFMRGAIFAPPQPESRSKNQELSKTETKAPEQIETKKESIKKFDPYRESPV